MISKHRFSSIPPALKVLAALSLAAVALAAPAVGQPGRSRIASLTVWPGGAQWRPLGTFERLVLTIAGQDRHLRREYGPGEVASFDLKDASGGLLPDGTYTWEIRAWTRKPSGLRRGPDGVSGDAPGGPGPSAEALVESGGLLIRGGVLLDPRVAEGPATSGGLTRGPSDVVKRDQVIADDLIVQGSGCFGLDCVNNENFGFDTVRLKENNTRIQFDDTSATPGFPTTNWQIRANDSGSGGRGYLAFVDQGPTSQSDTGNLVFGVEATARINALWVSSAGRVGLGTATPALDVTIVRGNTPAIRLEQDGSSGFTPQTWDIAGNETNFFVRDATSASKLPLRIVPGAPSNALFVAGGSGPTSGNVGLGTSAPSSSLHVRRADGTARILVKEENPTVTGRVLVALENPGPTRFQLNNTNAANIWNFAVDGGTNFNIDRPANAGIEMAVTGTGSVIILGTLTTGGPTCGTGCDLVFAPEYPLESIEEHAARMWEKRYLPAVGPTPEGQPFNVTEKTGGILNELEKAHIYIEQLHRRLEALESRLALSQETAAGAESE